MAKGHEVQAVLTASAAEFVSPLVLETFSGRKAYNSKIFRDEHLGTEHIQAARWAELFVIYGATANFLAKSALGFGDDFLTLQLLAFKGPVIMAPAMNPTMWEHPAVQANVRLLLERGMTLVGPKYAKVACGEEGLGHIAEDVEILAAVENLLRT